MPRPGVSIFALLLTAGSALAQTSDPRPDGRLEKITASQTIRIAHRTDARPFSFVDERNEVAGYTVDICKRVVEALQRRLALNALKIEWVPVTTQTRFDAVADGKADLECGASTITLGRMKQVDFSSVVFVESTGLLVRKADGILAGRQLAGKKIAVIAGTSNERAVTAANVGSGLNAVIVPVKDRAEGTALLEGGGADAFASDKLLLLGVQAERPEALAMLPDDISIEPYGIVVPRGDWELRLAVNGSLAEVFRKGEAVKAFETWFSPIGLRPGLLLGAAFVLGALPE
jgi:glutamate/aspartate transport system substrate-binding protein